MKKTTHVIDNGRIVTIETIAHVDVRNTCIRTMRVSWTHPLFKTHEEIILTLVADADGNDHVVWPNGTIVDAIFASMTSDENVELFAALDAHIEANV